MRYSLKIILTAFFSVTALYGCIREDRSECNPGLYLQYDYSLNKEYMNLFGAEVGKVSVFAFDEEGLYRGLYTEEGSHLTNDYAMHLPLSVGDYTLVVWGGTLNGYETGTESSADATFQSGLEEGITTLEQFMLSIEDAVSAQTRLSELWHGCIEAKSVYLDKPLAKAELMKNTKLLSVEIIDANIVGVKSEDYPYTVRCEGNNGQYMYDNSFGKKNPIITYKPHNIVLDKGQMKTETNILRLVEGSPVRLIVEDKDGKTILNKDIVYELLRSDFYNSQEDLDREDIIEIKIDRNQDVSITITINGWELVEVIPEI